MGRSTRRGFFLFILLANVITAGAWGFLYVSGIAVTYLQMVSLTWWLLLLIGIGTLGMSVRRLHDMNVSGWWLVFMLVPVINVVMLLVLIVWAGSVGPNHYGRDPRGRASKGDQDRGRGAQGIKLEGL